MSQIHIDVPGHIWEANESLQKIPCLNTPPKGRKPKELNLLIKFCYHFVDPKSNLYREDDFSWRRKRAIEKAGIPVSSQVYKDIHKKSEWFHEVLTAYFVIVNNTKYELWCSLKMKLSSLNEKVRSEVGTDMDYKEAIALLKYIEELEQGLFPNDYVQEVLEAESLKSRLAGWAELYALELPHNQLQ